MALQLPKQNFAPPARKDDPDGSLRGGCQRSDQVLFDTLYHAVALHAPETTLITADPRYFDKAEAVGQIARLRDLPLSPSESNRESLRRINLYYSNENYYHLNSN